MPVSENGDVKRSICNGAVGPKNNIVFKIDTVIFNIRLYDHKGSIFLGINIEPVLGKVIKWHNEEVFVKTYNSDINIAKLKEVYEFDYEKQEKIDLKISDPMTAKTMKLMNGRDSVKNNYNAVYILNINNTKNIKSIKLMPLKVQIGDRPFRIPEIEFKKKRGLFLYPINC